MRMAKLGSDSAIADSLAYHSNLPALHAAALGGRVVELDGLRALAIILVFLCHVSERTFPGGWLGVDIFFVLSGYLITLSLLREQDVYGRISLRNFFLRRVLRLAPAFVVVLIAFAAVMVCFRIQPVEYVFWSVLYSTLYVANYIMAFEVWQMGGRGLGHIWSLAIEEQFYLLWPLFLVLFGPRLGRKMPYVILAMIFLVVVWRAALVLLGASIPRTFFAFDTRADSLLIGCGLAYVLHYQILIHQVRVVARRLSFVTLGVFFVLALTLDWEIRAVHLGGFTVLGVFAALLIVAATAPGPSLLKIMLGHPPIVYLGRISYGVYLWHDPVLVVLRHYFADRVFLLGGLASIVSLIIAGASFRYIEQPFLRLRADPRTS
jgi:peptidoglycan/LPS O-acetylase OafA/YrhL